MQDAFAGISEVFITYTNRGKAGVMLHIGADHSSNCQIILKLFGYDIFCNNLRHKKFKTNLEVSEVLITYITNRGEARVSCYIYGQVIAVMYQSLLSLTIPPGNFLKGRIPHPPGTGKVQNPNPWGRKIVLNPHPLGNYFQKSSKKNIKHEQKLRKTVLRC